MNQLTHPPLQFKESALRKQSLYLKFDPLLKDSPQRPLPVALQTRRYASPLVVELRAGGQVGRLAVAID